ncbi:putative helicase [Talaromyces proteolyticus]|uniref:Helicase n=1 Tax=Talaromyces proteolyticus TaxID=1131652 RepID=A0AAD4KIB4_9EURO|nr:putative helicase [Talaromyces proteolyticus]KAH8689021.1 putative helicase [Talaromyces proteolyticus]
MSLKRILNPVDHHESYDEYTSESDRSLSRRRIEDESEQPSTDTLSSIAPSDTLLDPTETFEGFMVGVEPTRVELICYGMIVHELAKLVGKGEELEKKLQYLLKHGSSYTPPSTHTLALSKSRDNQIFLKFADGMELGYLSEKMKHGLDNLIDKPLVEFNAVIHLRNVIDAISRARKSSEARFRVNINVYGPEEDRRHVGKELSDKGLFLQKPDERRQGTLYDNPHILPLDDMDDSVDNDTDHAEHDHSDQGEILNSSSDSRDENIQQTMAGVFSSLTRGDELNCVSGSEILNCPLYPHQEQALDFMLQRETGDIPAKYRMWQSKDIDGQKMYCHTITNFQHRDPPDESGGGILADEMGMGKTLTTLVLIGRTLNDSYSWVSGRKNHIEGPFCKKPCHATLIIVPSLVLINTWTREVEKRLNDKTTVLKYHGRGRKQDISNIEKVDIVITTYSSLAKEYGMEVEGRSQSLLHGYDWYRVVLDEAHTIRRQATTFHKAVTSLSAHSRWCLSGTPVQNTLMDLGALLAFIQVKPFHNVGNFRHWIATPFQEKARRHQAIERLVFLLDSMCLRRTIDRIDLPGHRECIREVVFSPEEREQYVDTWQTMRRIFDQQAGQYSHQEASFRMLQVHLELRSLCNHGTYQPQFSWAKRYSLLDDENNSLCSLTRTSMTRCLYCRNPMPITPRNQRSQYIEQCSHALCSECLQVTNKQLGPMEEVHCPLCKSLRTKTTAGDTNGYFKTIGRSTKLEILVSDVQDNLANTSSIIFSCWTRTLDLIGAYLSNAKIQFSRIDGKTPSTVRQKILDEFVECKNSSVLIMTTGTGAFGLNLRSVNRVFIVEPQWNPSVENQAIARAIRLGQKEQVLVIRYRVQDSIEQDMYSQQKQKLRISKMDFQKDLQSFRDGGQ